MIILIDNYDSFTYNLVHYLGDLDVPVEVFRNDRISVADIMGRGPKGLMISPGPGDPGQAGICLELVEKAAATRTPLLGVCLGHQAIGRALGGEIVKTAPLHGKISPVTHNGNSVFKGLPSPLSVTRYHSLIIERASCPAALEITAQTGDGLIMGVAHKALPLHGVQFHPESIATAHGRAMLENFVALL